MTEKLALSCYGVEICIIDSAGAGLCQRLRDALPPEFVFPTAPRSPVVSYVVTAETLRQTTEHSGYRIDGSEAHS